MQLELSIKERMLLEDEKSQEEVCVQKYKAYAKEAIDPELKRLFNKFADEEQHHYDMLNQMLNGQQPDMSHGDQTFVQTTQPRESTLDVALNNQSDKILCSDLLSTEKYVSGTYDTAIFECVNPVVRQALQHIQQDEQHHGEQLFQYMNSHGMYPVQ